MKLQGVKVAIYNAHLQTFGGGERLTYALARALSATGNTVDVVTSERVAPTVPEIQAAFGPEYVGFSVKREYDLSRYDVFINHSAGDATANPCRRGIYVVMFPFQDPGPYLDTYQEIVCISEFVARHTRARWGRPVKVIYPEVPDAQGSDTKTQSIVTLGRFNTSGHAKRQDLLIDSFLKLPQGWTLNVIGRLNAGHEAAFEALQTRVAGTAVTLHPNVSEATKHGLLARASLYWHGAGFGVDESTHPEQLEHFGIAVVEAMKHGAVPITCNKAGPAEIIHHGVSGFLARDIDELIAWSRHLMSNTALLNEFASAAAERGSRFSRALFDKEVNTLVY